MAIKTLGAALGYLNRLFVEGTLSGLSDDQLLDRFQATRCSVHRAMDDALAITRNEFNHLVLQCRSTRNDYSAVIL